MIRVEYEPIFEILESDAVGIADTKIGSKINATVNFRVIEKTKNYIVLKIDFMVLTNNKRLF